MTERDTTFSAPSYLRGIPGADDFAEYDRTHPDIWAAFQRIAFNLVRHGQERYGAKAIFEVIRYNIAINGDDGDAFKCNNNFTSCYARKFIFENPHLSDFFELRKAPAIKDPPAKEPPPKDLQTHVSLPSQAGRILAGQRHKKTNTGSKQKMLF